MAGRSSRQRVFMKTVSIEGIEVEVPRHDPRIVNRADSQPGIPIQLVAAGWGRVSGAARAHWPPSNQGFKFIRAEHLCGKVDNQSLGPIRQLLDEFGHGTVSEFIHVPTAGNDQMLPSA